LEQIILSRFDDIDEIDEALFQVRSTLRLSQDGLSLSVDKVFENIDSLNIAFAKVMGVLIEFKDRLASNLALSVDS
jgi:hypothetical protein